MKSLCLLLTLLAATPALAGRDTALRKTLGEGEALVLDVAGDLSMCKEYLCTVNVELASEKEKVRFKVEVEADGSWKAWYKDPVKEKAEKKKKEEEAKAKRKEEEAKKKAEGQKKDGEETKKADEDWKSKPILTVEERVKRQREKSHKDMDEVGSGTLEGAAPARTLTIPGNLLPKGALVVYANGWWGATLDGKKVGLKYGVAKISR
jgi:hypothetical protein